MPQPLNENNNTYRVIKNSHMDSVGLTSAESFNFTDVESIMWRKYQEYRFSKPNNILSERFYWTNVFIILTGIYVAGIGCFVTVFTDFLTEWKFASMRNAIEQNNYIMSFTVLLYKSIVLALVSGLFCYYQPFAAGSGIPEIKAFLNGFMISPNCMSFLTVLSKIFGMCFSVAAGLPVGKEGPMIHVGGIVGASTSQGNRGMGAYCGPGWLHKLFNSNFEFLNKFDRKPQNWKKYQDFRNDRSHRDFMGIGTAAGITAAYKAPLGGVLFMLEAGSSFWSSQLIFNASFCVMITILTVHIIFHQDLRTTYGLFALGNFDKLKDDGNPYFYIYEIPVFLVVGIVGGSLGALFNYIIEHMTTWRNKYIGNSKMIRLIELVVLTSVMVVVSFVIPYAATHVSSSVPLQSQQLQPQSNLNNNLNAASLSSFRLNNTSAPPLTHAFIPNAYNTNNNNNNNNNNSTAVATSMFCSQMPTASFSLQEIHLSRQLLQFTCSPGHYHQLASLYLVPSSVTIRLLYHMTPTSFFSITTLLLFLIPYFIMASVIPGVMAPTGLFLPTLLIGAGYGRLFGCILNACIRYSISISSGSSSSVMTTFLSSEGTYALVGSAALLSGSSRITISGIVILLEITGNMSYLLPLMMAFTGSRLFPCEGVYDMQLRMKKIPYLSDECFDTTNTNTSAAAVVRGEASSDGSGTSETRVPAVTAVTGYIRRNLAKSVSGFWSANDNTTVKNIVLHNYKPVSEIMKVNVVTVQELESITAIKHVLRNTRHHGFPVVSTSGQLRGLILRKTLCGLLQHNIDKMKRRQALSKQSQSSTSSSSSSSSGGGGGYYQSNNSQYTSHEHGVNSDNNEDNLKSNSKSSFRRSGVKSSVSRYQPLDSIPDVGDEGSESDDCEYDLLQAMVSRELSESHHCLLSSSDSTSFIPTVAAAAADINDNTYDDAYEDLYTHEPKTRGIICRDSSYAINKELRSPTVQLTEKAVENFISLEKYYPIYPEISADTLDELIEENPTQIMDLRHYMDFSPCMVNMNASIIRCYTYFRTIGLRHIVVVDGDLKVIGMVTRHELANS